METTDTVFSQMRTVLEEESQKDYMERDYLKLIDLGNKTICILLRAEDLSSKEKEHLYTLITLLHTSEGKKVQQQYNLCEYKIARELIFKFGPHKTAPLRQWVNWFFYDYLLVSKALEQLIAINRVNGY